MSVIQKMEKMRWDVEKLELSYTAGENVKCFGQRSGSTSSVKQSHRVPQQSHCQVYAQHKWKHVCTKTCTGTKFTAALFAIAKNWNQPKCPSTDSG